MLPNYELYPKTNFCGKLNEICDYTW